MGTMKLMKETVVLSLALAGHALFAAAFYPSDLLFYSKFDSAADVTNPQVGASGVGPEATFQPGASGQALYVPALTTVAEFPLPEGVPIDKGCIEFQAKVLNTRDFFVDGGDPMFFCLETDEDLLELCLELNGNNGVGSAGLNVQGAAGIACVGGKSSRYADILGEEDPKGWHHYALVWNTNGVAGTAYSHHVYVDGKLFMTASKDRIDSAEMQRNFGSVRKVVFSRPPVFGHGKSPYLIDEFRIWSTDKTVFSLEPIEPEEDETGPAMVSEVSAKQHYPWAGKIDITYKVSGATAGLAVKIVVRDTIGCMNYTARTFDVTPSSRPGVHTVVWNATADGVKVGSKAMVATVSLVVPEK